MRRKEAWIIALALALVAALWAGWSVMNEDVTETAPLERVEEQNTGTNAPQEVVPPAEINPANTNNGSGN